MLGFERFFSGSPKEISVMRSLRCRLGLLALVSFFLIACSPPAEESGGESSNPTPPEPVTWRFALEEIEGSVQDAYAQEFGRRIEAASDGAIQVEIYPYGSLGTSSQITEMLQSGALELAFASPGHLADAIPEVGVFTLHFVLSDDDVVNRQVLSNPDLHELLQGPYRNQDLQLLAIVQEGWMVWSADRVLRSPEDFEGLKIRTMTSPILVESYRAYGANPTPMPYSEVYSGLQLGQIDGQVNPVFAIEEMSFYEEQDVLTSGRHAQFVTTLAASRPWFDGLDEQTRGMVEEVRDGLVEWIDREQQAFNARRLDLILDAGGIEWVELSETEREAFREASLGVRDVYVEQAGDAGQEILDTLLSLVQQYDN
jgi:TRAP-type C4-dicarboxylate transport system substrate-binding protein